MSQPLPGVDAPPRDPAGDAPAVELLPAAREIVALRSVFLSAFCTWLSAWMGHPCILMDSLPGRD